jgi:hypothetical protein
MAVSARLYQDLRGSHRHNVAVESTLRDGTLRPFDVVVEDLSATGVRVPAVTPLAPGALITLGIPGIGMCNARVARVDARGYGCEFLFPLSPDELADALVAVPADPIPFVPATAIAGGVPLPEPVTDRGRLPGPARAGIMVGLSAAGWAACYLVLHPPF